MNKNYLNLNFQVIVPLKIIIKKPLRLLTLKWSDDAVFNPALHGCRMIFNTHLTKLFKEFLLGD